MKPTGSKLHRAWRCPASMVLPWSSSDHHEERTEPARGRGQAIHRFLERVKVVGVEEALAEVPAEIEPLCRALDLDNLPAHLATEVAFAWNWRTRRARELGRGLGHREYATLENPPTDDEIACTIDTVGLAVLDGGRRRGYCGDYKSGRTRYPRPEAFAQTLLGACCIRDALSCDDVVVELTYIHDDGTDHKVRDTVDAWVLDSFEADVERVMRDRDELSAEYKAGRSLPVVEGDHCDYCGAYAACPAKVALVRAVPAELTALGVEVVPAFDGSIELTINSQAINRRTAGQMYMAVERIEEILGKLKGQICELGWHEPVLLPDGRVIEPRETVKRALDGRTAAGVLERRYGREEAMKAVQVDVSIAAVKEVAMRHMERGQKMTKKDGTGVLDLLLDEIDKAGGLARNVSTHCSPRHPRKKSG